MTILEQDKTLKDRARSALDARIDSKSITITVHDGAVTLRGTVPTLRERRAASDILLTVPGVTAIENSLTVTYPYGDAPEDIGIENAARSMLRAQSDLDHSTINVEVEEGVALLSGTTNSFYERSLAEDLVCCLAGVRGVENRLKVRQPTAQTDREVTASIRESLARNPHVDTDRITVRVEGGIVRLDGEVEGIRTYRQVYDAAWITPGVTAIDDTNLTVRAA